MKISTAYKLTPEEVQQIATLIARPEFRAVEKLLQWKIAVLTDDVMSEPDERKSYGLKMAASKYSELTGHLAQIWERHQEGEKEKVTTKEEKPKKVRIFGPHESKKSSTPQR